MKKMILAACLLFSITGCNAQNDNNKKEKVTSGQTTQNNPKVDWKVNKQFDSNGNLIGYDSTFSWSYSTDAGGQQLGGDSLMNAFKSGLGSPFPSLFQGSFGKLFMNDSLFYHDFFTNDYFFQNMRDDKFFDHSQMTQEMDRLSNEIFNQRTRTPQELPKT